VTRVPLQAERVIAGETSEQELAQASYYRTALAPMVEGILSLEGDSGPHDSGANAAAGVCEVAAGASGDICSSSSSSSVEAAQQHDASEL